MTLPYESFVRGLRRGSEGSGSCSRRRRGRWVAKRVHEDRRLSYEWAKLGEKTDTGRLRLGIGFAPAARFGSRIVTDYCATRD